MKGSWEICMFYVDIYIFKDSTYIYKQVYMFINTYLRILECHYLMEKIIN